MSAASKVGAASPEPKGASEGSPTSGRPTSADPTSPIRRGSAGSDDGRVGRSREVSSTEVAIGPYAARLLTAAYNGNLAAFEGVLADYRAAKGVDYIEPRDDGRDESMGTSRASSPATSPTRRRVPARRRDPKVPPNAVDAASAELLEHPITRRDITGVALFWAGYMGHSPIINHIQRNYEAVFVKQCRYVTRKLFDNQKDLAAVSLIVRNGTPAAVISEGRGDTALHRLAKRTKPDASLMNELLKTYKKHRTVRDGSSSTIGREGEEDEDEEDDVDALNGEGYSALHIVSIHSKGIDGRTAAQVLMAHGADVLLECGKGGNARTISQNPHVRAALGYQSSASPVVDEETKSKIDSAKSVNDLPPLPEIEGANDQSTRDDAERNLNPNAATEEDKSLAMRSVCRLDKDGVEAMVRRLYDNTIQLREEKAAARRQALEIGESRRLTADEQQAVSERLCDESMEAKAAKMEELREKYLVKRDPNPLDEETQAESAARLCNQAMDHKKEKLKELDDRFWSDGASPKKVISKEQMQACARRLHDECTAKSQEKFEKLATKYLAKSKGEFTKEPRKLTQAEREEALARLTQPISR